MNIKNDNYVCIQGWMINELKLSGTELILYALIFGFSQDGKSWYQGSVEYAGAWCGVSRQSASANLKKLVDKKLVEKDSIIGIGDKYRVSRNFTPTCKETLHLPVKKLDDTCKETLHLPVKKLDDTCKESLHNNINNIVDNINKIECEKKAEEKKQKKGVYIEIGEHYTKEYEEVKKQKPVIVYPAVNKRIKSLLESGITDEQIKQSITVAKKDRWIVDTGKFSLLTILSDNVLSRLLSDIPKPSSRPSSSRSCPSCGSELVGLFCKTCMIQYNEKMEAVF